ncbi:MAG TPA: DUF72 domain-containing protein [Longimicrobiales bacterium]|nr:DUF72 domain-containing protein [Longimicrobiales bacterium]
MPAGQRYRIGTQGWNYDAWGGVFYPPGTRSGDRLELYSRVFDTVEVDSTFYAMPPGDRFRSWYERTPDDFVFTAKLPRDITHDARLVDAEGILFEFCDRASLLREKLGALLVQLPPDMGVSERPAVESFVRGLPREIEFAVEFRDPAWFDARTADLLSENGVAMAVSVGPWLADPAAREVAAAAPGAFQYLRWMGAPRHQRLNESIVGQRTEDLGAWAATIRGAAKPIVYAYFNNDYLGHSPDSARALQQWLGITPADPALLREQGDLFT